MAKNNLKKKIYQRNFGPKEIVYPTEVYTDLKVGAKLTEGQANKHMDVLQRKNSKYRYKGAPETASMTGCDLMFICQVLQL